MYCKNCDKVVPVKEAAAEFNWVAAICGVAVVVGLCRGLALGWANMILLGIIAGGVVMGVFGGTRRACPTCSITLSRKYPDRQRQCPRCQRSLPPSARYCSGCGYELGR